MTGTRSRPSRSRPSQQTLPQSDDIPIAARRLLDLLQSPRCQNIPSQPICEALAHLLDAPGVDHAQVHAARLLSPLLRPLHSDNPALRLRVARLALVCAQWHVTDPNDAFATLSALLTACLPSSNGIYSTTTLSVALQAVALVCARATRHIEVRQAAVRHVPALVPLLHTLLFHADLPAGGESPLTSPASGASDSSRVRPIRADAIRARVALALLEAVNAAPQAMLPFWPQLLPMRSGVSRSSLPARRNLATLLLFEHDEAIRSTTVSLCSALVLSARPFLQLRARHSPHAVEHSSGFVPASERVLASCVTLHSVVASALCAEPARLIVPKLCRLAADLAGMARPPAVPLNAFVALLDALQTTLLRPRHRDLTVRAAAASALALALSTSGHVLVHRDYLSPLCKRVVPAIVTEDDDTCPIEEMLTILKHCVSIQVNIFPTVWPPLIQFCTEALNSTESARALHVVRLVESFILALVPLFKSGEETTQPLVTLACQVYRTLLRDAVCYKFHAVQISAIFAMDALLQLIPGDSTDAAPDYILSSAAAIGLVATSRDTVLEILNTLIQLVESSAPASVRSAAAKAVSSIYVEHVNDVMVVSLLRTLSSAARGSADGDHVQVCGRAMASFATIMDKLMSNGMKMNEYVINVLVDMTLFAHEYMRSANVQRLRNGSASVRSNVELSRLAAIQVISSFLCVFQSQTGSFEGNGAAHTVGTNVFRLLYDFLCDEQETVNLRCGCCKAAGRVLVCPVLKGSTEIDEKRRALHDTLMERVGHEEAARVQASAAKALTEVVSDGFLEPEDCIVILRQSGRSWMWSVTQLHSLEVSNKERGQYMHLQTCVGELVSITLSRLSSSETADDGCFGEVSGPLIEAVCSHGSVPKYLTERLVDLHNGGEVKDLLADKNVVFSDTLDPQKSEMIKKIVSRSGKNGGKSRASRS